MVITIFSVVEISCMEKAVTSVPPAAGNFPVQYVDPYGTDAYGVASRFVLPISTVSVITNEEGLIIKALNDYCENFYRSDADGYQFQRLILSDSSIDIMKFIQTPLKNGATITHIAAFKNDIKRLEWLFKNNADLEVKDEKFETPLIFAALSGDIKSDDEGQQLIEWFSKGNVKMHYMAKHRGALKAAAESNNCHIIRALHAIGIQDKRKIASNNEPEVQTALFGAAITNNYSAVNLLLKLYRYNIQELEIASFVTTDTKIGSLLQNLLKEKRVALKRTRVVIMVIATVGICFVIDFVVSGIGSVIFDR